MEVVLTNTAGIRELKTNLSAYMQRVKAGETVIITEHGKPVGQIIPISESLEAKLHAMVESGLAEWNGEKFVPHIPTVKLQGDRTIASIVSENRE